MKPSNKIIRPICMLFKLKTVYKTPRPEDDSRAEYYTIFLLRKVFRGQAMFFLHEKHGFFEDAEKTAHGSVETFGDKEGYASMSEAIDRFEAQLQRRAKDGFIHSFARAYTGNGEGRSEYAIVEVVRK